MNRHFITGFVVASLFVSTTSIAIAQDEKQGKDQTQIRIPTQDDQRDKDDKGELRVKDGRVSFDFLNMPWGEVIPWFAEQAGLSLTFNIEPPEGSFEYHDEETYTVLEAIDRLNYSLGLKGQTLIRNGKLLVLVPADMRMPDNLIEFVTPEELDERGKYEVIKCIFKLDGLDVEKFERDIESLISRNHRDSFLVIPAADQMFVRETGGVLRSIRDVLDAAKAKQLLGSTSVASIELKHVSPAEILEVVRGLMGMDRDSNKLKDGSFSVTVQPLGTKLFYTGSREKVAQFEGIVKQVDVLPDDADATPYEKPFVRQYPLTGNPEIMFKVLQTIVAGRDVRLEIDEISNQVIFQGRTDDHELVKETLEQISAETRSWAVIILKELDVDDAVDVLSTLYPSDSETPAANAPIFYPDSVANQLIIKGMPAQVKEIEAMLASLDVPLDLNSGPRKYTRIVDLESNVRVDEEMLTDLFGLVGKSNRLNFVMPKNFEGNKSFNKKGLEPRDRVIDPKEPEGRFEPDSRTPDSRKSDTQEKSQDPVDKNDTSAPTIQGVSALIPALTRMDVFATSYISYTPQDDTTKTQDTPPRTELIPKDKAQDEEKKVEDPPSVPGAPMTVKITDYGIVLDSLDLDALDEYEALLNRRLNETSGPAKPTVYFLQYADPLQAKDMLDKMLGQSSPDSGGGGGGNPLANMIGGAVSNAMPGMGDLFGGLMGGGGADGGDTGLETEGEIIIIPDVRLRSLVVRGTKNDVALVGDLIVDYIDQPEAPHAPEMLGRTRAIKIAYRDPVVLKDLIVNQIKDIVDTGEQGAAGNPQQQQQQMQAQMLKQLMGNRGGGGNDRDPEEDKPKVRIGVDEEGRQLLVTGPLFIYNEIVQIVNELDTPEITKRETQLMLDLKGLNPEMVKKILAAQLGDKMIAQSDTESAANGGSTQTGRTGSSSSRLGQTQASSIQQQQRAAFMQAIQRAQQQRGGGRGGGGAGGGRGGGGAGGGRGGGGAGGGRGGR